METRTVQISCFQISSIFFDDSVHIVIEYPCFHTKLQHVASLSLGLGVIQEFLRSTYHELSPGMSDTEEEMPLCCVGNTEQEGQVQHSGGGRGEIRWFPLFVNCTDW